MPVEPAGTTPDPRTPRRTLASLLGLVALAVALAGCTAAGSDTLPASRLVKTAGLHSTFATQAALADHDHLYAVANELVVQYDRRTGRETARSTGDAAHLNQGIFLDGMFLLAHSNYPDKPDRSDIKQLDPRTMALTLYKDLGVTDGSLTWIARQGDAWWCNFAFYGPDNHKTYLAKFDDHWRELARWTYPRAVIDRMGDASISSGLWHDGCILAIGHSKPELYRLRLPATGSVLELVETFPSPFPGQGIAHDPAGAGLVGISRPDRTIITARWER